MLPKQDSKVQVEGFASSELIASQMESRTQTSIPSNISHNTWNPQNFHTLTTLAKGTYSTIQLVQSPHTKKLYAVKARSKTLIQENSETNFILTEKDILLLAQKERYPFIVGVFGGFQTSSQILLYLEYCGGGSLSQCLQNGGRFGVEKTS